MLNDDDEIVTNCVHRKGSGRACAMCLIETVRDLQSEQQRATRKLFEDWETGQFNCILKPSSERR